MSDVVEEVDQEPEQESSIIPPGEQLKRARENKNLEQLDIAKELKLDLRFVDALEDGRLDDLPQPVYTAGYIRAYSKLVGLAPDDIVAEYTSHQKSSIKNSTKEKEHIPSHYGHVQTTLPKSFSVGHGQSDEKKKFHFLISVLVIVVLIAIGWQINTKKTESIVPDTPNADVIEKEPAADGQSKTGESAAQGSAGEGSVESDKPDSETIKLPLPAIESKPDDDGIDQTVGAEKYTKELLENASEVTKISIHYSEDSWVDIRDATGKAIIRRLGVAGDSNTVSGVAPFEVLLGYSPGVSIEYDGKPYDMSAYNKRRVARFVLNGGQNKSIENGIDDNALADNQD